MNKLTALSLGLLTLTAAAAQLQVGDRAPVVQLPDQTNAPVDLAAHYGHRYVALAFYPKDDTGGCTRQAKSITAGLDKLKAAGVVVYGVSVQGVDEKKAFCDKHGLIQGMLSDTTKSVCQAFGTLGPSGLSNRWTVLIDPGRVVRLIDKAVKVDTQGDDIAAQVAKLQTEATATQLATLSEPQEVAGARLRLPVGWERDVGVKAPGGWGYVGTWAPPVPGVSLGVFTKPGAVTVADLQAGLPEGAKLLVTETLPVRDGLGHLAYTVAEQAVEVLLLRAGEQTLQVKATVPLDRAADAARLLAAMVTID
ncbi:MAG: redoxin domain-containing protein [Fimbriimonadaceae bacterium]|nr:redoxin domain-containing protein [Fimbriimonadaceae bacterium]